MALIKTLFTNAVNFAKGLAKMVGEKASIGQIAGYLLGQIPMVALDLAAFTGADKERRIRDAWEEFDARTGLEGADIIRSLPEDAEERLFDGIKTVGLELSLWAAGVYGQKPSEGEVLAVGKALSMSLTGEVASIGGNGPGFKNPDDAAAAGDVSRYLEVLQLHDRKPQSYLVAEQIAAIRRAVIWRLT